MLLSELLAGFIKIEAEFDCHIFGLSMDSRKLQLGFLFLAYPGQTQDGRRFIQDAIEQGVAAIVADTDEKSAFASWKQHAGGKIPLIFLPKLQQKIGIIASRFYQHPSDQLFIFGVCGTNGKTSCSQYIAQILGKTGKKCGVVGTLGAGLLSNLQVSHYTTPNVISLQELLSNFINEGVDAVAMEVSSHGLAQSRVKGVDFDIGIFTNLSHDHLDYHGDMEGYWRAKRSLFLDYGIKRIVVNVDDDYGQRLLKELPTDTEVVTYGIGNTTAMVKADQLRLSIKGSQAHVVSPWGEGIMRSRLLGRFNVSNLLGVITALSLYGLNFQETLKHVAQLTAVPGRMQSFGGDRLPLVVVDFAHTPDALEQALIALREHCRSELWCVFGCGGERDAGKRSIMGKIAERYADQVIITNDNPRGEDPDKIVADIKSELLCPWAVEVELGRRAAIAHAIECAKSEDIILVAGKGYEQFQQIKNEKLPFNDVVVVQELLAKLTDDQQKMVAK